MKRREFLKFSSILGFLGIPSLSFGKNKAIINSDKRELIERNFTNNKENHLSIIKKYDKNNNMIYRRDSDGREFWYKYKNNNLIHIKTSDGKEDWYERDENNNLIHYKNSYNSYEFWRECNKNNNLIHYKDTLGEEHWHKYDEDNNRIEITKQEFKLINI